MAELVVVLTSNKPGGEKEEKGKCSYYGNNLISGKIWVIMS